MVFLLGKVPIEVLEEIVFMNLGAERDDVILNPAIGEDAALVRAGNQVLAISSDPITGAKEWLGWLAVHVSANDIATRGIQPRWFNSVMLLPENSSNTLIEKICKQMDKAARQLNVAITGGHCEITPGITHPIVTGCAVGVAENGKYVTSSGAKKGDRIILTKGAGIEGTAILASDRKQELQSAFNKSLVEKAENYFKKISVVKEALIAFKTGGVSAMHDPTEGGVAGGLQELAIAANIGLKVYEKNIFVPEETRKICAYYEIDPLQLISSGSLLIIAEETKTNEIISNLSKNGVHASIIGEITEPAQGRNMISKIGEETELARPVNDHLWTALAKPPKI